MSFIKTKEENNAALILIESLMNLDPAPWEEDAELLRQLTAEVQNYEESILAHWIPIQGQAVYSLSSKGNISESSWTGGDKQKNRMKMGMVYRSRTQAEKAKKVIQELMKRFHQDKNL